MSVDPGGACDAVDAGGDRARGETGPHPAWLSSASAAGAGRRGGDPWAHGDVFVNDDATIRENDALRNAFSTGAMAAPLKTLVTAAGAIDAAAMAAALAGANQRRSAGPGLSDVLTPDTVGEMLRDGDVRQRLMEQIGRAHV